MTLYRVTMPGGTVKSFTAGRGEVLTCPAEWESWARFGSRYLALRLTMRGATVETVWFETSTSGHEAPSNHL